MSYVSSPVSRSSSPSLNSDIMPDVFPIVCNSLTTLAQLKNELEKYHDLTLDVLEEFQEEGPVELYRFCKELGEWLEQQGSQYCTALEYLEIWKENVESVRQAEQREISALLPVIAIINR